MMRVSESKESVLSFPSMSIIADFDGKGTMIPSNGLFYLVQLFFLFRST